MSSYKLVEDRDRSYHREDGRNRIVQGENRHVLRALQDTYAGKVRCVYLDPPYNTGNAFTHYKDKKSTESWADGIRSLLRGAHGLLTNAGSVWLSIDDHEVHTLRVLLDEVFGKQNFISTVVWERRTSRENRACFSVSHDFVLVYAKDAKAFKQSRNLLPPSRKSLASYKNPDQDPRGPWNPISFLAQSGRARPEQQYALKTPAGNRLAPPEGNCWRYTKDRYRELLADNRVYFGRDGQGKPVTKMFLSERRKVGLTPHTIWTAQEVGTNGDAKKHLVSLFPGRKFPFDHPKPETLLQRILHISTNPGDLVLDLYGGSGTTAAVAHKMGRRWIVVEREEHCDTVIRKRLKKVVKGTDPGGCTEAVKWQGGGGFRYCTVVKV